MNIFSLQNDKWLRFLGIPFIGFCIPFVTKLTTPCSVNEFFINNPYLFSISTVVVVFESNRWILAKFRNRYAALKDTIKRISFQLSTQLVATFIILFVFLYTWYIVLLGAMIYWPSFWNNVYVGMTVPVIITLLYEATYFISKWKEEFIRNQTLTSESTKAQLHILKKQLDPHFMFNSLGTLSSLIEYDPDGATEFVNEFSDIYRYILNNKDETLATVENEIAFANNYISLLKKRFDEASLILQIDVDINNYEKRIPTLTIQILVENIIKHNALSAKNPLVIKIYIENNSKLVIENNIQKKRFTRASTKVGLHSIKERYALIANKEIEVHETPDTFIVKAPLLMEIDLNEDINYRG